jgi:hypothetical protein
MRSGVDLNMLAAVWMRIMLLIIGWMAAAVVAIIAGIVLGTSFLAILLASGGAWTCVVLMLFSVPSSRIEL